MNRPVFITLILLPLLTLVGTMLWLRTGVEETPATPMLPPHSDLEPVSEAIAPREHRALAEGVVLADVAREMDSFHTENLAPEEEIAILQDIIAFFRRANDGKNPFGGLNEEIVSAMTGANHVKLAVLDPAHPAISDNGELLDRWGTPYQFHPVSRDRMDIISAGPDRQLWTDDDISSPTAEPIDVATEETSPDSENEAQIN